MSQSLAPEDSALPTTNANEAQSALARSAGHRIAHPAPHLVGTPKTQLRHGGQEESRDPGMHQQIESLRAEFHLLSRVPSGHLAKGFLHEATKRSVDIVGTALIALVFSPVLVVVCLALWLQGGPVIYRHRRIGRGGRSFECLKFRTMVPNADQVLRELLETNPELKREWVEDHKLRDDPRVTSVGRFLRRSSLDELPQLWNVLRGEMSLVGPRPIIREEMLRYGRNIRDYLAGKPGITGLWQIMGRNDTSYRRRVALDTYYVRNCSLVLDLYVLAKTAGVVLNKSGAY
jgi:exopolysaccharide production protein ExoY